MRVALALVAVLAAGPAFAASDEPMSTAGAASAPPAADPAAPAKPAAPAMTTAEQIDAFLRTSPARDRDSSQAVDGVVLRDDRQVHGVVEVGVGTGGYRSIYVQSDMPVGDSGRISLAFGDTRYGSHAYPYGYYGGPGYYGYGGQRGSAPMGMVDRQRCDLEGMSASRPLDVTGGPNGRCVGPPRR